MGVLNCSRRDCTNVMCDRLSSEHGYICDECFDELVKAGIGTDVHKFMERETDNELNLDAATEYFDGLFPDMGYGHRYEE